MISPAAQAVIEAWKIDVCARSGEIDPENEHDWQSLFVGFAVGRGLPLSEALSSDLYYDHAFPEEA